VGFAARLRGGTRPSAAVRPAVVPAAGPAERPLVFIGDFTRRSGDPRPIAAESGGQLTSAPYMLNRPAIQG